MHVRRLLIRNFRGIKSLDLTLGADSGLCCLIGSGDSGKSTILHALEWVLWPRYSLNVSDTDFFECDYGQPIAIEVTLTDFPVELITEDKFCFYQRRLDYDESEDDPIDGKPVALTIRLEISSDLEPAWCVCKNNKEPRRISAADRAKLPVHVVGEYSEKDTTWSRYSVLQKYAATSQNPLKAPSVNAARMLADVPLSDLDAVSKGIPKAVSPYGVPLDDDGNVSNHFIVNGSSLSAQAGMFSGKVPLSLLGEGSKRLFSTGLGIESAKQQGALILIDEVETALEPHRLINLIRKLKESGDGGRFQVIITTHSPVALCELDASDLYAVTNKTGAVLCNNLLCASGCSSDAIQRQVRRSPESFLSKKAIVCEGNTEVGLIRALDEATAKVNNGVGFASVGAFPAGSGGGSNMFSYAHHLLGLGYSPCILMDSDVDGRQGEKYAGEVKQLRNAGISVFAWEKGLCLEKQVFKDISDEGVKRLIGAAITQRNYDSVKSQLMNKGLVLDELLSAGSFTQGQRAAIAAASIEKGKEWFKSVSGGIVLGKVVTTDVTFKSTNSNKLTTTLLDLQSWALEHA